LDMLVISSIGASVLFSWKIKCEAINKSGVLVCAS
jgi:hypothetical protein